MSELSGHCRERADQGDRRAMALDSAAVSDCDLAGLLGLTELAQGWCGPPVRGRGAPWSQSLPAMQAVGVGELSETRDRIRVLVHPQPAAVAAAAQREPVTLRRCEPAVTRPDRARAGALADLLDLGAAAAADLGLIATARLWGRRELSSPTPSGPATVDPRPRPGLQP